MIPESECKIGKGAAMRIPIKIMSLATTFFWIFLIAILITAVYSAKDFQCSFGQPQLRTTSDNKLLFSIPITILNKGFYDIDYFNLTTKILDKDRFEITNGSTFIPVIEKGQEVNATNNMTMDVNDLLQRNENYLFNDSELGIDEIGSIRIAEIIPVQASTNFSIPWGAPLYNFTLGQYRYTPINFTQASVTIPISFDNHASFDLDGSIQIRMYNNTNGFVGGGQTDIEVLQSSRCSGYIEFVVQTMGITESGHFEVYFNTSFFDYGPIVIPYG
jgi:hypothetical protein